MKVLWWAGSNDGSSWYRMTEPAAALRWLLDENGKPHECRVSQRISMREIEMADVVVVARAAKPDAHEAIRIARTQGKRVIVDLDDDFWHIDPSNIAAHRFWNAKMLRGLEYALEMADAVTVASFGLAQVVRDKITRPAKVHVVENALHAGWLSNPRDYEALDRPLIIGWAGTQNTAEWLPECALAINLALRRHPNVKFLAVGVPFELLRDAGIELTKQVGAIRWEQHGLPYLRRVSQFDIWIAPYERTPFNLAKFPTKALEAGFHGIPLVASRIEPYLRWDAPDGCTQETALHVRHPAQWAAHLERLIGDAEMRRRLGQNARSRAAHNISQVMNLRWEQVLGGTL